MAFNEKPKPCPFCGEIPQLNEETNEVMHACSVLNKEIRTGRNAWNIRQGSLSEKDIYKIIDYLEIMSNMDLMYLENEYTREDFRYLHLYSMIDSVSDVACRYASITNLIEKLREEK